LIKELTAVALLANTVAFTFGHPIIQTTASFRRKCYKRIKITNKTSLDNLNKLISPLN